MKKYFRYKLENLLIIDKIVTIHYFEFNKNFISKEERHDFWELVYVDKSEILCKADGREILLKQGEMLFHKPNELHSLSANGKNAPDVFIISFECKSEAIKIFENKKLSLKKTYAQFIYYIIEEAKRTFDIPYSDPNLKKLKLLPSPALGGQQQIKNYLEILLINIIRSLTETTGGNDMFLQQRELDNKLVKDILKILQENIQNTLTVNDICSRIGYSRAYVFRKFKLVVGTSVMEYFISLKIEKAKELLRENNFSVKEISDMLAFDTPNYFSKTFKRVTKLTPSAYKKRSSAL